MLLAAPVARVARAAARAFGASPSAARSAVMPHPFGAAASRGGAAARASTLVTAAVAAGAPAPHSRPPRGRRARG
jgi:hypothetical protein